jgi:SAM-dependent methyltransferase
MTEALRDRGLHVVGVDASPAMLERARDLLGPDVPLVRGVLPKLPVEGVFDAAVSTLDGLNYLTLADFRASLAAIADRLRPGGWLAFDLHGDAALGFLSAHPVIAGETAWGAFTLTNTVDMATRACTTTIDLAAPEPARSFTETHVQYVHAADDVRDALRDAGFAEVHALVEYTPVLADVDTLRVTWLARRA